MSHRFYYWCSSDGFKTRPMQQNRSLNLPYLTRTALSPDHSHPPSVATARSWRSARASRYRRPSQKYEQTQCNRRQIWTKIVVIELMSLTLRKISSCVSSSSISNKSVAKSFILVSKSIVWGTFRKFEMANHSLRSSIFYFFVYSRRMALLKQILSSCSSSKLSKFSKLSS